MLRRAALPVRVWSVAVVVAATLVCGAGWLAPRPAAADGASSYSPTGLVAYEVDSGGTSQIWVVNRDGTGAHQLTSGDHDSRPKWSPSGNRLMFDRTSAYTAWVPKLDPSTGELIGRQDVPDTATDVFVLDLRTGQETQLTPSTTYFPGDPAGMATEVGDTGVQLDFFGLEWLPDESGVFAERSYTTLDGDDSAPNGGITSSVHEMLRSDGSWSVYDGLSVGQFTCANGSPPDPSSDLESIGGYPRVVGIPNPDPATPTMAITSSGYCATRFENYASVGQADASSEPSTVAVDWPTTDGQSIVAGWTGDGSGLYVQGPAQALWRIPVAGGTPIAVTAPQTADDLWSYQRVHFPGPDCYGLLYRGSFPQAVSSIDDGVIVQVASVGAAFDFPGRPDPVAGGRWCDAGEIPADQTAGLFVTDVSTGATLPLRGAVSPDQVVAPSVQCTPGSCLAGIRLVKHSLVDTQHPGTFPTDFHYSLGDGSATVTLADGAPGGASTFVRLGAGDYDITEAVADGWDLTDISCTGVGSAVTDLPGRTVSITVPSSGGILDCVFTSTATDSPAPPGPISGSVVADTGSVPLAGIRVRAFTTDGALAGQVFSDDTGDWSLDGLDPGDYLLEFADPTNSQYRLEFFPDTNKPSDAVPVATNTSGIEAHLGLIHPADMISGTAVADGTGAALPGIRVRAFTSSGQLVAQTFTGSSGEWTVTGLHTGAAYLLQFSDPVNGDYRLEWFPDATAPADATAVVAGIAGVTAHLGLIHPAGAISGAVVDDALGTPLQGIRVRALTPAGTLAAQGSTAADGSWTLGGLHEGTSYVVQFSDPSNGVYQLEFYADAKRPSTATPVASGATGIVGRLAPISGSP